MGCCGRADGPPGYIAGRGRELLSGSLLLRGVLSGDCVRTVPESDGLELKVAYIGFSRSLAEVRRLL